MLPTRVTQPSITPFSQPKSLQSPTPHSYTTQNAPAKQKRRNPTRLFILHFLGDRERIKHLKLNAQKKLLKNKTKKKHYKIIRKSTDQTRFVCCFGGLEEAVDWMERIICWWKFMAHSRRESLVDRDKRGFNVVLLAVYLLLLFLLLLLLLLPSPLLQGGLEKQKKKRREEEEEEVEKEEEEGGGGEEGMVDLFHLIQLFERWTQPSIVRQFTIGRERQSHTFRRWFTVNIDASPPMLVIKLPTQKSSNKVPKTWQPHLWIWSTVMAFKTHFKW